MSSEFVTSDLINEILRLSDPYFALSRKVKLIENFLRIGKDEIKCKRPIVISLGKAALRMAKWAMDKLSPVACIVITNIIGEKIENVEIIESSHPNPSEKSVFAAKRIIEVLNQYEYDLALFLISGGSSAMIELPAIPLEDYIKVNEVLLKSALTIIEMNIVRKHLSLIKGGRLALYSKAPVVSLIISDVLGNDISAVGSGLTCEDPSTFKEAYEIIKNLDVPESAKKYIEKGVKGEVEETPKKLANAINYLILDNMEVLKGLKNKLPNSKIITSQLTGESREVAKSIASIVNSIIDYDIPFKKPCNLILGGEPYVTVKGKGKGGRNSEFALSFLTTASRKSKWKLLAFATDGIDGNSEYAGCIATSDMEVDNISYYFENNDTYSFFEKMGKTIKTGYTGTNVNNVYIISVE